MGIKFLLNLEFYSSVGIPVLAQSGHLICSGTYNLAEILPGLKGPVNLNLPNFSYNSPGFLWKSL